MFFADNDKMLYVNIQTFLKKINNTLTIRFIKILYEVIQTKNYKKLYVTRSNRNRKSTINLSKRKMKKL